MRKALVCLLLALACTAHAVTITGRVVGVADGHTITVLDADKVQHKIRLAGIDAPEKKQAFGNRSKESLSDLAFDKTVNVETSKRDRYGRQIGKVLVNTAHPGNRRKYLCPPRQLRALLGGTSSQIALPCVSSRYSPCSC